ADHDSRRRPPLDRILSAIVCPDHYAGIQNVFVGEVRMIGAPTLEIAVLLLGLGVLLLEAFVEKIEKRSLALAGIVGLGVVLVASFFLLPEPIDHSSAL